MNLVDENLNHSSFFNDFKEGDFSKVSSIENLDLKDNLFDDEMNNKDIMHNNSIGIIGENDDKIVLDVDSDDDEFNLDLEIKELMSNRGKLSLAIGTGGNDKIKTSSKRKKRNKEDLDKTPLPIFDCIFCSNQKVVFVHMIREIQSEKYLYNCSNLDFEKIGVVISALSGISSGHLFDNSTQNLMNFIIYHTEYLNKYYTKDVIVKRLKKLLIPQQQNDCHSFTNDEVGLNKNQNDLDGEVQMVKSMTHTNTNVHTNTHANTHSHTPSQSKLKPKLKFPIFLFDSNINITLFKTSIAGKLKIKGGSSNDMRFSSKIYQEFSPNFSNFYSNSLNYQKNEDELFLKPNPEDIKEDVNLENEDSDNAGLSDNFNGCENDEDRYTNESFLNFLKFDLKRKITVKDISWESEEHDIYNPTYHSENEANKKDNSFKDNNCLNNENENFSLQFSNNSSNINNLFDTNSNIKYNFPDKSMNVNNSQNCSNMIQFKTVLSYNSELTPMESISTFLNKTDNNLNTNNVKCKKKLTFNDNKSFVFNNRGNMCLSQRTNSEIVNSHVGWVSSRKNSSYINNKISSIKENSLEYHFESYKKVKNSRQSSLNYFSNKTNSFKGKISTSNKSNYDTPDATMNKVAKMKIEKSKISSPLSNWVFKSFDSKENTNYFKKFQNMNDNKNTKKMSNYFLSLNSSKNLNSNLNSNVNSNLNTHANVNVNHNKISNESSKNYLHSTNNNSNFLGSNSSNKLKMKSNGKNENSNPSNINNFISSCYVGSYSFSKNLSKTKMKYETKDTQNAKSNVNINVNTIDNRIKKLSYNDLKLDKLLPKFEDITKKASSHNRNKNNLIFIQNSNESNSNLFTSSNSTITKLQSIVGSYSGGFKKKYINYPIKTKE